ncbi:hypothetical protein M0R45_006258 [Rubus argutus]|uniref:Uncharacterized protein n=1 Tax=Rubus argutus TaxID=59490 RepID=A0AAW1YQA8_RUBAR
MKASPSLLTVLLFYGLLLSEYSSNNVEAASEGFSGHLMNQLRVVSNRVRRASPPPPPKSNPPVHFFPPRRRQSPPPPPPKSNPSVHFSPPPPRQSPPPPLSAE